MHNFYANYLKILSVLDIIEEKSSYLKQIRKPKLSDKELIAINLTAEYLGIDSESELFRKLPPPLFDSIERSVYNRRKRKLFDFQEEIRQNLYERLDTSKSCYIVDSMPLEVCKLSRSLRSTICKNELYSSPNRGYCASQAMSYYGYKLHAVCSSEGVVRCLDLTPASVHDIHYLNDVKQQLSNCIVLGDKGYLSAKIQLNLFETRAIKLEVPMRRNQINFKEQPYLFRKTRKRIETIFSQLCDQFNIRRNYAKTFDGFKTRILTKITAFTVIQFINKYLYNRKMNNIKVSIT